MKKKEANTEVKYYRFCYGTYLVFVGVLFVLLNIVSIVDKSVTPLIVSSVLVAVFLPYIAVSAARCLHYKKAVFECVQILKAKAVYIGERKGARYVVFDMEIDGEIREVATHAIFSAGKNAFLGVAAYASVPLNVGYDRDKNCAVIIGKASD